MRYLNLIVTLSLLITLYALSACSISKERVKKEASVHYGLGVVYLNEGNLSEAIKELNIAIDRYADDPDYHNAIGLAYFAKRMNLMAIKHFKKAIELKPKLSAAHTNLSAAYLREGKWDNAIDEASLALDNILYRTPEYAYLNRGRGYYEKAEYSKALNDLRMALKENPRYTDTYYHMGLTYMAMDRLKDAEEAFNHLLAYNPDSVSTHYRLGLVYIKLNKLDSARKEFNEVVRLDPNGKLAKSSLNYLKLLK